ncbi:MAG: hypothetical protein K9G62_06925 [Alphaproteobacteria bacterium]|nr:hypothetical protein [Alphaproteobacteria bacterium]
MSKPQTIDEYLDIVVTEQTDTARRANHLISAERKADVTGQNIGPQLRKLGINREDIYFSAGQGSLNVSKGCGSGASAIGILVAKQYFEKIASKEPPTRLQKKFLVAGVGAINEYIREEKINNTGPLNNAMDAVEGLLNKAGWRPKSIEAAKKKTSAIYKQSILVPNS